MVDWRGATPRPGIEEALFRFRRAWRERALLVLTLADEHVTLDMLRIPTDSRRRGFGASLMAEWLAIADAFAVPVRLQVYSLGGAVGGLSQAELENWYERLGFVRTGGFSPTGQPIMVREPRAIVKPSGPGAHWPPSLHAAAKTPGLTSTAGDVRQTPYVAPQQNVVRSGMMMTEKTREKAMGPVWDTKYGKRRVKHSPPDLTEALEAARDISSEPDQQAEIAASLMGLPVDDVKKEMRRLQVKPRPETISIAGRRSTAQVVVVERSPRRKVIVNRPR